MLKFIQSFGAGGAEDKHENVKAPNAPIHEYVFGGGSAAEKRKINMVSVWDSKQYHVWFL